MVIYLIRLVPLIIRPFTHPIHLFVSFHIYNLYYVYFNIGNIIDSWKKHSAAADVWL